MAWKMKAKYYEACNCAYGCPCNMNGFPTHGKCEGTISFQVVSGDRDGVDLSGVKVVSGVKWPGAIHEGGGVEAMFIDATEEQRDAIVAIVTGEDPGLPFEILAATVSEVRGPFFEKIEIDDNGNDSRVRVGDKVDVQFASFTSPVSGEKHEVHMLIPGGFIFQDGLIGTTSTFEFDAEGVSLSHPGNNAYYSEVEWSSENRMAPVVTGKF